MLPYLKTPVADICERAFTVGAIGYYKRDARSKSIRLIKDRLKSDAQQVRCSADPTPQGKDYFTNR
jgi:hypothetical protein